jgi:DNA invertase Pin-like site-specific DNA recombinase
LQELIGLVNELRGRGVGFVSLRESLDTTAPGGRLFYHVLGAVAEFERDLILERTKAGLEAARARGRKGGSRPVMDERKIALASKLMRDRETPVSAVCEAVGVFRTTLYRYVGATWGRRHVPWSVAGLEWRTGV